MSPSDLLKSVTQELSKAKDVDNPKLEAKWIIERALGLSADHVLVNSELEVDASQMAFIDKAVRQRIDGCPLAYVLGEKEFFGITFHVNQHVLIPRPESEHLVESAIQWIEKNKILSPRVLDLGAGSGCIGLSILKKIERAQLCSIDASVEAMDVVDFNSKSLGLVNQVRLMTLDVDLLRPNDLPEGFAGKADIILANPPYLNVDDPLVDENVRMNEPAMALFADEAGFGSIRRWANVAAELLSDKGIVLFEIGHDQGAQAKELFLSMQTYSEVEVLQDYSGRDRIIKAIRG